MLLIGMTGPIGHGKTTFADALAAHVPKTCRFESFYIVAEVANKLHHALQKLPDPQDIDQLNDWISALPAILKQTVQCDCTFDQLRLDTSDIETHPVEYQKLLLHVENLRRNPQLAKQPITRDNKEAYRPFLQWIGGYVVKKVDAGIWYKALLRRVLQAQQEGCELCIVSGLRYPMDAQLLREAGGVIVKVYRPGHLQNDMLDPTERERENIHPDCTIMSNGSVEDMRHFAARFLADVRSKQLQPLYQTKDA